MARDPLTLARRRLAESGVPEPEIAQAEQRAAKTVADAIEGAKAAPDADPSQASMDVWADGGAAWRT